MTQLTEMERIVTPDLARLRLRANGPLVFDDVVDRFDPLCAQFLAELAENGDAPAQIILSISDRDLEFGATDPEAVQFFEYYDVVDGACVWRGF